MPIPKPEAGEAEDKYISRCISEIASEYDAEGQAYAVCKGEFDKPTQMDDVYTEKILAGLPEPKPSQEGREAYVKRCIPSLYPSTFDQQQAASYCSLKYEHKQLNSETSIEEMKKLIRSQIH